MGSRHGDIMGILLVVESHLLEDHLFEDMEFLLKVVNIVFHL